MKTPNPKTPPPPRSTTLYGTEHGNTILPHLCAPMEQLDFHAGGFEHHGDAYYNCWPEHSDNHGWTMFGRGIHVTQSIEDIEYLLGKSYKEGGGGIIITERCVNELTKRGCSVYLIRRRKIIITHTLVAEIFCSPNGARRQSVTEDSLKTEQHNIGQMMC